MTLSDYIAPNTTAWYSISAWVTNSTISELLGRLVQYGSDIFTLNEMNMHSTDRAHSLASSKTVLSTLIGGNVAMLPSEPLNATNFLHTLYKLYLWMDIRFPILIQP